MAKILQFPPITKCLQCAGTGLTWSIQRRSGRNQAAAKCPACAGSGKSRNAIKSQSPR